MSPNRLCKATTAWFSHPFQHMACCVSLPIQNIPHQPRHTPIPGRTAPHQVHCSTQPCITGPSRHGPSLCSCSGTHGLAALLSLVQQPILTQPPRQLTTVAHQRPLLEDRAMFCSLLTPTA